MNIYDFFNSPDVAAHCRSVGKELDALEAAIMVRQSHHKTLNEKHDAYRMILSDYPDISLADSLHHGPVDSFHEILANILETERRVVRHFMQIEPGEFYRLELNFNNDKFRRPDSDFYTSLDMLMADIHEDYDEDDWNATGCIRISKYAPDKGPSQTVQINYAGDIMSIFLANSGRADEDEVVDEVWDFLDDYYIDIPIPFKRGDLVYADAHPHYMSAVMVMESCARDIPELHQRLLRYNDCSDMTAKVYYECNGNICCDHMHFWPDLRYYRQEPTGHARILKNLSLYLQGKIDLCTLLKLQTFIHHDETAKIMRNNHPINYVINHLEK